MKRDTDAVIKLIPEALPVEAEAAVNGAGGET